MPLSNENKGRANYANCFKLKKAKPSIQKIRRVTDKPYDSDRIKKMQEVNLGKICRCKNRGDCWQLKSKCYICQDVRNIAAKCREKPNNNLSSFSSPKKLCYTRKVTKSHPSQN